MVEYLEEELVVALLENDDDDEREEEIIFAGERTRIIKTGICYGVSFQRRSKKESKRKRKKNKNERVYLNPNCHKTLKFFLSFSSSPLLCWTTLIKKRRERHETHVVE